MNSSVSSIYSAALKLMAPLSAEATYETIVTEAQSLSRSLYGSIFLYTNGKLQRVYSNVPKKLQIEPRKDGYTYQAFSKREIKVIDTQVIEEAHPEYSNKRSLKKIFIPLSYESFSIGIVTLDSNDIHPLTPPELDLLKLFGSLASLKLRTVMLVTELQNAVETRDLFISMASHELKTPLTTVSAYAQLIERSLSSGKDIKPEWPSTLKYASHRMTRLINELLHVNQIRTGKMQYRFQAIDPMSVVTEAITEVKMSNSQLKLELKDERDDKIGMVWADTDKLRQVIINLLNNAAKFNREEKPITITVCNKRKKVVINVTDQGQGIRPEDLEHLFEEFYKAKNNTKEGLGLGLFISQKIVSAHKGKIDVKSQVDKGTSVIVTLPVTYV